MKYHDAHLEQAQKNIAVFQSLKSFNPTDSSLNEWMVVILFYAALHLVHAILAFRMGENGYSNQLQGENNGTDTKILTSHYHFIKNIDPSVIWGQKSGLGIHNTLSTQKKIEEQKNVDDAVYQAYKQLYALSRKARYLETIKIKKLNNLNNIVLEFEVTEATTKLDLIIDFYNDVINPKQPLTPLNIP